MSEEESSLPAVGRYKLQDPKRLALGREIKVRVDCPSTRFPEDVLKPKVDLLTLSLKIADPEQPNPFSKIFGVDEVLKPHGLDLSVRKTRLPAYRRQAQHSPRSNPLLLLPMPKTPFRHGGPYRGQKKSQKPR